jgi:hypothetical protein
VTANEDRPEQRTIRTLPFNDAAPGDIAALFACPLRPAGFKLRNAPVMQLDVPSASGAAPTTLTFWPSLRRVDAISASAVVVFTNVVTVDLVEGVEALFRRESGEYLIVAIGGKVIVRA